tara:strand:+ start:379 stop:885 length:507 start_codon:yes stop_codon:yes gene_type:complete
MINTQTYINNIVNDMESFTWTSVDGAGTSGFLAVYSFPMWEHDAGFPYLVILDNPSGTSTYSNADGEFLNNIEFHICANYSVVSGSTESDQREEAMLRIREAYDALREYVFDDTNIDGWLSAPANAVRGSHSSMVWRKDDLGIEDNNIDELNLYRRTLTLPITDIVNL